MKKLIIAAAIVCAAVVSQAAAVGWNLAGCTNYKGGDYSVFVIGQNGVTGVDQIKTIVEAGGLDAADAYAWSGGTVNNSGAGTKTAAASGATIGWTGPGTETYTAFIFVQNAAGDQASYTGTANITMDNDSTSKSFTFGNQSANVNNNSFAVATPEPTSGLLLLLGIGAMALRRRRV